MSVGKHLIYVSPNEQFQSQLPQKTESHFEFKDINQLGATADRDKSMRVLPEFERTFDLQVGESIWRVKFNILCNPSHRDAVLHNLKGVLNAEAGGLNRQLDSELCAGRGKQVELSFCLLPGRA